jgi:hypothetical protein
VGTAATIQLNEVLMLIRQQQCLAVFLLLIALLVGCNSPKPTPIVQTALKPLLVQPEDLGWPADSYFESESYVPGEIAVEASIASGIGPNSLPRRSSNISAFRSSQDVWIYANEDAATQTFNFLVDRYQIGFLAEGSSIELPELTNNWWFCNEGLYDAKLGNYMNCFSLAQRGRILVRRIMPVNGQTITFEDWQNYVTQMHQRLVDYSIDSEAQN